MSDSTSAGCYPWFLPPLDNFEIAKKRQNMPNDIEVRKQNTCNLKDFYNVNLIPECIVTCQPGKLIISDRLRTLLNKIKHSQNNQK